MKSTSVFLLILACGGGPCGAQDSAPGNAVERPTTPPQSRSQDAAAIRAGAEAFVAAFNKGDAKAIAAMWTKNGEYIDDTGRRYAGRVSIEKGYEELFAADPHAKIEITIDSIRLVGQNTAIEDGRAALRPLPPGEAGSGRYTAVHVKVDGKWLMASVRDSWVESPPANRSAADLEWLIGTWEAEEFGAKTEFVCRWVAEGSFIERRYTTTLPDGKKMSGVQLVGWNPQNGHVQSWDFSPDGGHAVGVWSPIEGGWQAIVNGVTGGGVTTSAVNRLIRLDDNAYAWQSVRRLLGDDPLPATDEVIIKRRTAP